MQNWKKYYDKTKKHTINTNKKTKIIECAKMN